jgi:acetyl-CoA carboxylase biotin carboxyl carrier protein
MTEVRSEINAVVWKVVVEVGQEVADGDELVILESMKMEIPVTATAAGAVAELRVAPEDPVRAGDVLVVLDPV